MWKASWYYSMLEFETWKRKGSPQTKTILPISLILAVPGWVLLISLVTKTVPELTNRWLFLCRHCFIDHRFFPSR